MGHWLARVHKKWQSWDSTPDMPDCVVFLLHPTFSPQLSHISAGTVSALLHANISHHGDACISWSSLSMTVRVPRAWVFPPKNTSWELTGALSSGQAFKVKQGLTWRNSCAIKSSLQHWVLGSLSSRLPSAPICYEIHFPHLDLHFL